MLSSSIQSSVKAGTEQDLKVNPGKKTFQYMRVSHLPFNLEIELRLCSFFGKSIKIGMVL